MHLININMFEPLHLYTTKSYTSVRLDWIKMDQGVNAVLTTSLFNCT